MQFLSAINLAKQIMPQINCVQGLFKTTFRRCGIEYERSIKKKK